MDKKTKILNLVFAISLLLLTAINFIKTLLNIAELSNILNVVLGIGFAADLVLLIVIIIRMVRYKKKN